jgi:threonine synthase
MKFLSTRGQAVPLDFSAALQQGLAPDGGLYVPESWPKFEPEQFDSLNTLPAVARRLLQPFVADDLLESQLEGIVGEAFNFSAPVRWLDPPVAGRLGVLELHHGPTAAFKDFGARFLAACFARLRATQELPLNILVATSGDTGGAVAAAFHRRAHIEVTVLFPRGLVSPTQERQLTCWGDNVRSFAVDGTFDDCQRLVKAAFQDPLLSSRQALSSANSINLGRLLPQAVYYASSSLEYWREHGRALNYIIPSGNLGNAVACIWARQLGLPVGEVILAHNANRTVPDYLTSGEWRPRASVATLASAMDVGHPSNMERLQWLFPAIESIRAQVTAISVDDQAICQRIRRDHESMREVWCPHTATAAEVWAGLEPRRRQQADWCLVATASPAKFPEIVEPLIGTPIELPSSLAELLDRPTSVERLPAALDALRERLLVGRV